MTRTEIINRFMQRNNYTSYLEIGVQNGVNFHHVKADIKVGVDPELNSKATVYLTSDEFFESNKQKFDLIFIDGLHHSEQVFKDIQNSLKSLNKGGTIVCHDMNPTTEAMQQVPRIQTEWTGDCWKAFVHIRTLMKCLRMYVIDTDYGVGIIQKGKRTKEVLLNGFSIELNYASFERNKKEWLNLISKEEFLKVMSEPSKHKD